MLTIVPDGTDHKIDDLNLDPLVPEIEKRDVGKDVLASGNP